jgi:hypothetical protein
MGTGFLQNDAAGALPMLPAGRAALAVLLPARTSTTGPGVLARVAERSPSARSRSRGSPAPERRGATLHVVTHEAGADQEKLGESRDRGSVISGSSSIDPARASQVNVRLRAPATSANLGPGFDCAGMALELWNELELSEADEHRRRGRGRRRSPRRRGTAPISVCAPLP